jgi:hypothetical protein
VESALEIARRAFAKRQRPSDCARLALLAPKDISLTSTLSGKDLSVRESDAKGSPPRGEVAGQASQALQYQWYENNEINEIRTTVAVSVSALPRLAGSTYNDHNDQTAKAAVNTRVLVVDDLGIVEPTPLWVREVRTSPYDEGQWARLSNGWWRPSWALRPIGTAVSSTVPSIVVGDLVNARNAAGEIVTATPRRVVALKENKGRTWVHLEGSSTGWPADQIELVARHDDGTHPAPPRVGDGSMDGAFEEGVV